MLTYQLTNHNISITNNKINIEPNNSNGNINLVFSSVIKNQFSILKTGFINKEIKVTCDHCEYNGILYQYANITFELIGKSIRFILRNSIGNVIFSKTEYIEAIRTL